MLKIACVIVTHDRLAKLQKALAAYEAQTVAPFAIIIVDNNSQEETSAYLADWQLKPSPAIKKIVLTLPQNKGSAGGFALGCQRAVALGAEWIWLAPDDAYPEPEALAASQKYLLGRDLPVDENTQPAAGLLDPDLVAICGAVYEQGQLALAHRQRYKAGLWKFEQLPVPEKEYAESSFPVQLCSSVGLLLKAETLLTQGSLDAEYFMYASELDYSYRLSKAGKILCVPAIKVQHDLALHGKMQPAAVPSESVTADWRTYYRLRNYFAFLKQHFPLIYRIQWNKEHSKVRMQMMTGRNLVLNNLKNKALEDARLDRMGLCKVYGPK